MSIKRYAERWGCLGIILLILAAIVGFSALFPPSPPLTPEELKESKELQRLQSIAQCVVEGMADDIERSRKELPVLPTRDEWVQRCVPVVDHFNKLYPQFPLTRNQLRQAAECKRTLVCYLTGGTCQLQGCI